MMGVLHLWEILEDAKSNMKVDDLKGKIFAVDLATWICESESVKPLKGLRTRPYLRNLFFRVSVLRKANINLMFVLDGKAPELKLETIAKRLASNNESPKKQSSGIRSRLNMKLNECCKLLDALGIPWIKAEGEAESLCAELNAIGLVDGVMTNDGDAFLYGAKTVIRNLSSEKNAIIEMYTMEAVKEKLGFDRNDLIALGLLLGCDYCPKGVAGVGVAQATKLLSSFKNTDSLEVFNLWRKSNSSHNVSYPHKKPTHCSTCGHEGTKKDHIVTGCTSCKDNCKQVTSNEKVDLPVIPCTCDWHRNEQKRKINALEEKVKTAALQDPRFPDQEIIQEFLKQQKYVDSLKSIPSEPRANLELLKGKFQAASPSLAKASRYLNKMLDWTISYAFTKVLPLVTSFVLAHANCLEPQINLDRIVRKRVKDFVPSLEVKWKLLTKDLLDELPDSIDTTTTESEANMRAVFPDEVNIFHESLQQEKDDKIKARAEIRKAARKCKAAEMRRLASSNTRITDYFKMKKGRDGLSRGASKIGKNLEELLVQHGTIKQLEVQFQSLSVSGNTTSCRTKASVSSTKDAFQQQGSIKLDTNDAHLKCSAVTDSKPKAVRPVILFSSDSECDSDSENRISAKFVTLQSHDIEGCIDKGAGMTDTMKPLSGNCDITFSQDINFSLGSSFLNCLDSSLPSSPSNVAEKQSHEPSTVLKDSNCLNAARRYDHSSHQSSSTPSKSQEHEVYVTDSPVFMTLMERLNARKNISSQKHT